MSDVLLLNADGAPMSIVPLSTLRWQEAIRQVYLDRVDVLHEYPNWVLHSQRLSIHVPSVIMHRDYVQARRRPTFTKHNLCVRDKYTCQYCSKPFPPSQLQKEHVIPRSRGGKTNWTNIVMACEKCNSDKADKLAMKPTRMPREPTHYELAHIAKQYPIKVPDESWIPYLGWDETLITIYSRRKK